MRTLHSLARFVGPLAALLVALAPRLCAQGKVWVVANNAAPGVDFTKLQPAIDAATDGDTLLIKAGIYSNPASGGAAGVLDGKGLTLLAEAGALPTIAGGLGGVAIAVRNLGPGQRCVLRGVSARTWFGRGVEVTNCAGTVWIDRSEVVSQAVNWPLSNGADAALFADATERLLLSATTVNAEGAPVDALRMRSSNVIAYDCSFHGGGTSSFCADGSVFTVASGGAGVHALSGFLLGSGCTITGGTGGGGCVGLQWCTPGGAGGTGLLVDAQVATPAEIHLLETSIVAGVGGKGGFLPPFGPGCANGAAGVVSSAPPGAIDMFPGLARSLAWTSPIRAGQAAHASYDGVAGDFVFLAYALGFKGVWFPGFFGELVPNYPPSVFVLGTTASGALALDVPFAPFPAGLDVLHAYAQAFALGAGGEMLLGAPSQLSVLNQAF